MEAMAFSGDKKIDDAALRATMRDAVDRGEFRVYYQPIVGFDPGEVAGFEALLRWEPRIDVKDVEVTAGTADRGELFINVTYTLKGEHDPRSLVYPYYLLP